MPVLDIAGSQILPDMFGSYQRGKALRLQEESEARKMQMEEERLALSERQVAVQEANAATSQAKVMQDMLDSAAEETRKSVTDDKLRAAKKPLLQAAIDNPGVETTQAYLNHLQATEPNVFRLLGNKWDTNGDGILDTEVAQNALSMINAVDAANPTEREELAQAFIDVQQNEQGSPVHQSALLTIQKAQKDAKFAPGAPVRVYDPTSPTGYRYVSREESLGHAAPARAAMEMEMGPDGTMRMKSGGDVPIGAQTQSIDSLKNTLSAYTESKELELMTEAELKEVLTISGRAETIFDIGREKIGIQLDEADKERLAEAERFMSRSTKVYADFLFARGGKNLTANEKKTMRGLLPQPGETWLDLKFNSITQFETRIEQLNEYMEKAMIREFILATNSTLSDMSPEQLEEMFPYNGEQYRIMRAKFFVSQDANPLDLGFDPSTATEEELRIILSKEE